MFIFPAICGNDVLAMSVMRTSAVFEEVLRADKNGLTDSWREKTVSQDLWRWKESQGSSVFTLK